MANSSSARFGNAPAATYFDQPAKVLRIGRASEFPVIEGDFADFTSPESQVSTPQSQISAASPVESNTAAQSSTLDKNEFQMICLPEKKAKVARPPNSFILYRQFYHPIILQNQPDLSNCDISKVIGKQWHSEPAAVREEWKAKAIKIKNQHALENPGYQYAPRKASEKKRRMTSRKLAKLRAADVASQSQADLDIEMMDIADFEKSSTNNPVVANRPHEVAMFYPDDKPISTKTLLSNERSSAYPSHYKKNLYTDDMTIVFPAGHSTVEHDYDIRSSRYEPRDLSEYMTFGTDPNCDTLYAPVSTTVQADLFMNDLIDREAIDADAQWVHRAVGQNKYEVLKFKDTAERAEFQEAMNKLLAAFE